MENAGSRRRGCNCSTSMAPPRRCVNEQRRCARAARGDGSDALPSCAHPQDHLGERRYVYAHARHGRLGGAVPVQARTVQHAVRVRRRGGGHLDQFRSAKRRDCSTTRSIVSGRSPRRWRRRNAADTIGLRGPYGSSWPVDAARGKDVCIVCRRHRACAPPACGVHPARQRDLFGRIILLYGGPQPARPAVPRRTREMGERERRWKRW